MKLDITTDEYVETDSYRHLLLDRYSDQPDTPPLRTYTLDEMAAEKLRCLMQRLQCRDLFDIWVLFADGAVQPSAIRPLFEAKTRHRQIDPGQFADRFRKRCDQFRELWEEEMAGYMACPPTVERVLREVRSSLRQGGYGT